MSPGMKHGDASRGDNSRLLPLLRLVTSSEKLRTLFLLDQVRGHPWHALKHLSSNGALRRQMLRPPTRTVMGPCWEWGLPRHNQVKVSSFGRVPTQ